jgi:UDP-N-acetylmuramyl pentapeptide synthase
MMPHVTCIGVTGSCAKTTTTRLIGAVLERAHSFAFLASASAPRKTVIFGNLSDYSGSASTRYRQVARQALEVANVVFVGANAGFVKKLRQGEIADRLFAFRTAFEVSAYFKEHVMMPDELIGVRGSMSADHLERIVLYQFEPVVCWMDRCGKKRECPQCSNYTLPIYRPFRGSRRRSNRTNNDHCEGCSPSIDAPCPSRG